MSVLLLIGIQTHPKGNSLHLTGTSVSLKDCSRDIVWHIFVEENLIRFLPAVLPLIFMVLSCQRDEQLPLPLMYVIELIQVAEVGP